VPTTPKGWRCVIFFKLREEDGGDDSDGALTLAVVEELLMLRLLFRQPGLIFNVVCEVEPYLLHYSHLLLCGVSPMAKLRLQDIDASCIACDNEVCGRKWFTAFRLSSLYGTSSRKEEPTCELVGKATDEA
jgi:hypothetical protein